MLFINDAFAEATPPAGGGTEMLVMVGIFFVIMYFMIIRPQSKRQKEQKALMASISKGDEVVTSGGMMGKIKGVSDDVVRIELAENVIIKVQKHAINSVLPKGTISQD
ncbi:MAG: preprotein translocase subunit YajC [Gammaproteobacteria bacterium]|jgi:preprotein translocase subunit YajC|nr:preprotein translocase subunit YajC [Gammaproteobacteria bacterium]|tara:strand:- start:10251 stop:10574 length:324 start_codon:yes stop_codon:yes gene_type:complete